MKKEIRKKLREKDLKSDEGKDNTSNMYDGESQNQIKMI